MGGRRGVCRHPRPCGNRDLGTESAPMLCSPDPARGVLAPGQSRDGAASRGAGGFPLTFPEPPHRKTKAGAQGARCRGAANACWG